MQSKYLTDLIRYMELHWTEVDKTLMQHLADCLNRACAKHPEFLKLRIPAEKFSSDMPLNEFLSLVLPIERVGAWPLKESDYLITYEDKPKSQPCYRDQAEPLYLVADNIRSVFNIGSLLRSSECLGIRHVYLGGFSANPDETRVSKSAMGTEAYVSWSSHKDTIGLISDLKSQGIYVLALETVEHSKSLFQFDPAPKQSVAIVVGNERHGLSQDLLKLCDEVIKIPVYGRKNSLNVASAFSIAAAVIGQKIRDINL